MKDSAVKRGAHERLGPQCRFIHNQLHSFVERIDDAILLRANPPQHQADEVVVRDHRQPVADFRESNVRCRSRFVITHLPIRPAGVRQCRPAAAFEKSPAI
jgi:hypothetical protein